jgi:hypothetical protein
LKVTPARGDGPLEMEVTRAFIPEPGVELQVWVDSGRLVVDSTGLLPILDFERGKPIVLSAMSDHEFFVEADDHTRIAFVRDAAGKVTGAVLNPGPLQQAGTKID